MEIPSAQNHKRGTCLYEGLGTMFLLIGVNWSQGPHQPVAIGITLFLSIVLFGFAGGAHFNPAVTIMVLIKEGKFSNTPFALAIICSQIIGAIVGVLIVSLCLFEQDSTSFKMNVITILCPMAGGTECLSTGKEGQVFFIEVICTWGLATEIGCLKYFTRSKAALFHAFTVGLTLVGMLHVAGPISGGCINPAVGLVQSVFQYIVFQQYTDLSILDGPKITMNYLWIYLLAPLIGGILAGLFLVANQKLFDGIIEDATTKTCSSEVRIKEEYISQPPAMMELLDIKANPPGNGAYESITSQDPQFRTYVQTIDVNEAQLVHMQQQEGSIVEPNSKIMDIIQTDDGLSQRDKQDLITKQLI